MTIIKLESEKYKQIISDPAITGKNKQNLESQGVDSLNLSKKKDYYEKEIKTIKNIYKRYGLRIDEKNGSSFEIMMASYITPHNDEDFLEPSEEEGIHQKEYQLLMPIYLPEAGYDVYTFDIENGELLKVTSEINIPMILDYRNIHFALPSKLNKAEKEIYKVIIDKLKEIDFSKSNSSSKVFNLQKMIDRFKNEHETVRWGDPTEVKFLAGRFFGPDNIYDINPKVEKKAKLKM